MATRDKMQARQGIRFVQGLEVMLKSQEGKSFVQKSSEPRPHPSSGTNRY